MGAARCALLWLARPAVRAMRVLRGAQRGSAAALCRCCWASTAGSVPGPHFRSLAWQQHRRALRKRYRRSAPLSAATDTQVRLHSVLTCLQQKRSSPDYPGPHSARGVSAALVPAWAALLALCSTIVLPCTQSLSVAPQCKFSQQTACAHVLFRARWERVRREVGGQTWHCIQRARHVQACSSVRGLIQRTHCRRR